MTRKERFFEYVDGLFANDNDTPQEVIKYYESLKNADVKPLLTEGGTKILEYLQKYGAEDERPVTAKRIGEALDISPKKVNGSIRKLYADGFVDKGETTPVTYFLTTKGKEINILQYKENMEDEK